jgi:hypothetical protein
MSGESAPGSLAKAFAAVAAWLEGEHGAPVPASSADRLAKVFALDDFARNILLLGAYFALEPRAAMQIATIHKDAARPAPSIGLALAWLPGANWSSLGPMAPLRRDGLIVLSGERGFSAASFALAEPVLMALVDAPMLSDELALQARLVTPTGRVSPARAGLVAAISRQLQVPQPAALQLCGSDPVGKEQAAAHALAARKQPLYAIQAAMLPSTPAEIARLAQLWRRDLMLTLGWLLIDASGSREHQNLSLFAEYLGLPFILTTRDAVQVGRAPMVRLEMPRMSVAEQLPLWRERLGVHAKPLGAAVEKLASHFNAPPEMIDSIAAELTLATKAAREAAKAKAKTVVKTAGKADAKPAKALALDLEAIAWDAARRLARPQMDDLAQRVSADAGWDDLILPPAQKDTLKAILAQVRNRATVYESWGFAKRTGGRGLGVSALFAGPSGAGKTLAGEILGAELKLDVYRVDLSAIVSKWVGETEKNLRRVFDAAEDGGAVLQFDEADALFGKRSEVKDSHDRHANIEVSYLLQRLEEYRGLSILTTNLRNNIDPAFLRRLRFIIDFDFPSRPERERIWRGMFPKDTPLAELDYGLLGQLNLSGGSIRNVAVGAAFLAADEREKVTMAHILSAARLEYEKSGRALTDGELRGWPL